MVGRALHWVPMPTYAHGFRVAMGAIFVFMGGHRSMLMGVVWVWVQIRRKCWALVVGCMCANTMGLQQRANGDGVQ